MSKLYGEKIFNWEKIHDVPFEERKDAIVGAMIHFMNKVSKAPLKKVSAAKFAGVDTNLSGVAPIVLVQSDTIKTPDRGYDALFDEVNMRQSTSKTFEVIDVTGGVTFYQQLEGEEAKLSNIPTTAKTIISMLRFTGGYNILDDWLTYNEYYKIDKLSADTIRRWWDAKATIFYGLITALTGIDQAFDTGDVTTINNACANILTDLQAEGYVIDENAMFTIICHPLLRERIFRALANVFLNPNTNNNKIVFNIDTVISTTKMSSSNYWVGLPGENNQRGEWQDLNLRPPMRNELVLGAAHVWTGAYNGVIGQKKQFKKCALS